MILVKGNFPLVLSHWGFVAVTLSRHYGVACLGELGRRLEEDCLSRRDKVGRLKLLVLENRLYWRIGWKKIACLGEVVLEDMLPVSDKIVCLVWVV